MTEKKTDNLILDRIPNKEAEKAVVAYLERLFKKCPTDDKIASLVQKAPIILRSTIPTSKGIGITEKLREIGKSDINKAEYKPVESMSSPVALKHDTNISEPKIVKEKRKANARQWLRTALASLLFISAAVFEHICFLEITTVYSHEINSNNNFQTYSSDSTNYTEFNRLSSTPFQSTSFKKADQQAMYEAFLYQYRLRPDARFIDAFHLLIKRYGQLHYPDPNTSPFDIGTIKSNGNNIYIPLLKNGKPLIKISLGLPLRFSDIQSGLSKCLDFMDEKQNFTDITLVYNLERNETLKKAEQFIDMADPRFVAVGLSVLEYLWQKGQTDAYILKTTAKAYTMLLMVLNPDRMGYNDTFASEALVFLALARYMNPEILTDKEEFLLASNMGYQSHAESLMNNLVQTSIHKEDQILDAYARQDIKGLKALCKDHAGILEYYLLSRHYREIGLQHEATAVANELLQNFPTSYLSMFENINSGPLHVTKILTILYPLDLLRFIESKVSTERLNDLEPWIERIEGFSGDGVTSSISLTEFDRMLANWSPYDNESDYRFIIDKRRLKKIFLALYAKAVYARFEVLFSRWAVIEKAKAYVDSLAVADKEHPMVLYMQGLVFAQIGKQNEADKIFSKIITYPDVSFHLLYYAFCALGDRVHKLRHLPLVANGIDNRPTNRLRMGWLFQKDTYYYGLSSKYYESGLSQDPYQYWVYPHLSYIKGNIDPLLAALERSPYSYQLLIEGGKYFANRDDPKSLKRAAYFYELAQKLLPSKRSIALDHAWVLRKLKRFNEALEVLNTWLDHYGGNDIDTTVVKSQRAYIYIEMGRQKRL
ncbi:MAG: hypothetical protein SWO11_15065 [Thermodesulfobacteriota bacterium]|nr:hypothetical protein [Thermodesulfobacteriota bacterium]